MLGHRVPRSVVAVLRISVRVLYNLCDLVTNLRQQNVVLLQVLKAGLAINPLSPNIDQH